MVEKFAFNLHDKVKLSLSNESGEVIGRAEFTYAEPSYLIRYIGGDGRQVEQWQTESGIARA